MTHDAAGPVRPTADLLDRLVAGALRGDVPDPENLLAVLRTPDEALLDVVAAAARVRRHRFGTRVRLAYLVNLRSGLCPEDCTYCSQRLGAPSDILRYTWLRPTEALDAARAGVDGGAARVCLVASGRGPTDRDVARVAGIVSGIVAEHPGLEVCACLGLLSDGQAERLRDAGAHAYNHNLNTSEEAYAELCTTHGFDDRVATVRRVQGAGLSACSGLIAGAGESDAQLVDALLALRALEPDSVPVNFLVPFDGTPLAGRWDLTPQHCLRVLAAARFALPAAELRLAAGREVHLRTLQPLALHVVSSLFLGDYLTSEGQDASADRAMIADAGFEVDAVGAPSGGRSGRVAVRRRGAGTAEAPNA
ncbi:biotin synthase BioB [Cellulosimicrobium marinum]|uniref:biotin synthase BioB n=1 Tax=Cellulosimicrobium marinum TaxID=1638992 RepID=UPI001E638144|nr:biotin synthase BioB [Cellulosimicrobium marinum]MCB7135341.1 biotin synthase BioB [Cellulosimicrobium marinum]